MVIFEQIDYNSICTFEIVFAKNINVIFNLVLIVYKKVGLCAIQLYEIIIENIL